jgi:hypothetical protein
MVRLHHVPYDRDSEATEGAAFSAHVWPDGHKEIEGGNMPAT